MNDVDCSYSQHLCELCADAGIEIDSCKAELLLRYLSLVREYNSKVNLTRITSMEEAVILHLFDSLSVMREMSLDFDPSDNRISFLDMGTGAGFPGIPLCVCTAWSGTLVDSVNKKVNAVHEMAESLDIGRAKTLHGRLEELALQFRSSFDIVVARALAPASVLLEYASPFLKKRGILYVMKANPTDDEIEDARRVALICGMSLLRDSSFDLPDDMGHRRVLVYRKDSKPSIRLPRRIGEARKNPLQ